MIHIKEKQSFALVHSTISLVMSSLFSIMTYKASLWLPHHRYNGVEKMKGT